MTDFGHNDDFFTGEFQLLDSLPEDNLALPAGIRLW